TGQALIYGNGRNNGDSNPNTPIVNGPIITGTAKTSFAFAPADVNVGLNTITFSANHGLTTGQALAYENGGGVNIAGLTDKVIYYAIVVSPTTIKLALTPADAGLLNALVLGSAGAATQTLTPRF